MEALLSADTRQFLRTAFARLGSPVRLVLFARAGGSEASRAARRMVRGLASMSDRIAVETYELPRDQRAAAAYHVERAPAIAVVSERGRSLQFVGAPGGYEILALADAILLASAGDSGLSPASRARLAGLHAPLDLLGGVTPT